MPNEIITYASETFPDVLGFANKNRKGDYFNNVLVVTGSSPEEVSQGIETNALILACNSPYFERKLKTHAGPYQVQPSGFSQLIVEVDNTVRDSALAAIIEFFYSRVIEITLSTVLELLPAARLFEVEEVEQFCFEFLKSALDRETCVFVAKVSKEFDEDVLYDKAINYMSINLGYVAQTPDFQLLPPKIVSDYLSDCKLRDAEELDLTIAALTWLKHQHTEERKKSVGLFLHLSDDLNTVLSHNFDWELEYTKLMIQLHEKRLIFSPSNETKNAAPAIKGIGLKQSKLISIGGSETPLAVRDVYNSGGDLRGYADLPKGRSCHSSLLLDNQLYCIGGLDMDDDSEELTSKLVYRLDIGVLSAQWEPVESLNHERRAMGATVWQGLLVVAGGCVGDELVSHLNSTESYQPGAGEWRMLPLMNQHRSGHALVSLDDAIYAVGGWDGESYLSSVERLRLVDGIVGVWEFVQPMLTPRRYLAAVACQGLICAIGGRAEAVDNIFHGDTVTNQVMDSVEYYNSAANEWKEGQSLLVGRDCHTANAVGELIFVIGGLNLHSDPVSSLECFVETDKTFWKQPAGAVGYELFHHSSVAV